MVGWMKVLGCLGEGPARACGLAELRKRGVNARTYDDTTRIARATAEALTRAEDWFELHSRGDESLRRRHAMRAVRRLVEDSLDL